MDKINSIEIVQVGIVTKDIKRTAQNYAALFGLPMPNINQVPPYEQSKAVYRGKPMMSRAQICSFKMGAVQLEIVQPDDEDSIWKELLETKGEGAQFIGFMLEDPEGTAEFLKEKGIEPLHWGDLANGQAIYIMMDSMDKLGLALNIKGRKLVKS